MPANGKIVLITGVSHSSRRTLHPQALAVDLIVQNKALTRKQQLFVTDSFVIGMPAYFKQLLAR
jgi:hypothetical protein